MPVDEIYPPVDYPWWWAAIGVALILLVVVWVVIVLRRTRASAEEKSAAPPSAPFQSHRIDSYAALRATYDKRLDEVERRFRAGELDERALHLTLSTEVRGFASQRLGIDASILTLSEIERLNGAGRLTQLISRYYRPAFAEYDVDPVDAAGTSAQSISRAREVVRSW
ncbi:hypothetical protein [Oerskovia flava]|uniref:hypothetical protein n=1 Tax=Oerskovia flava TaxID=2986422 RepID=UPI00224007CA|nr:hypothetical protein [Oerskovia sp. JB1-3-2]